VHAQTHASHTHTLVLVLFIFFYTLSLGCTALYSVALNLAKTVYNYWVLRPVYWLWTSCISNEM